MGNESGELVYADVRQVTNNGDSLSVTLPKKQIERELDLDPREIESVFVRLEDDGQYSIFIDR
jgi:hypothetical protein